MPQDSLNRQIIKLTGPAILSNITVPLLGLSDTTIAGHLGSASFLAAMAVGSMMLNVIFWLCGFLRMGTTGVTAQAFGANDTATLRLIVRKAFVIALYISFIVLVLQRPLEWGLFKIIAPDTTVSAPASLYFRICVWSVPAQLVIMIATGWFIGVHNTVIPMAIAIGVNVINIVLSILLVFVFDVGFAGIAIGTLVANYIGAVCAMAILLFKLKTADRNTASPDKPAPNIQLLKINTNLFFRSACIMIVTLAMTSFGSRLGETTLAANAVIMQFFLFFSYFMDGFAFAGEAITGSSWGAGDYDRLKRCVKTLLEWGACMATFFLLVYLFAGGSITGLLTESDGVRSEVAKLHWWLVIMPPVTVAAFIFDGIFIGLARTGALLYTTLIATAAFFAVTLAVTSEGRLNNTLLWTAFGIYLLLRGVLLWADYVKLRNKVLSL